MLFARHASGRGPERTGNRVPIHVRHIDHLRRLTDDAGQIVRPKEPFHPRIHFADRWQLEERDRDLMRAGLRHDAHAPRSLRRRPEFLARLQREQLHPASIDRHFHPMLIGKADAAIALALDAAQQFDRDFVLTALREHVANQHAASRAEGQASHVLVLRQRLRHTELLRGRSWNRTRERRPAHLARSRQILLHL